MSRITEEDSGRIKILALAGWTPQEIAIKYSEKGYSPDQIRNHINRKHTEVKGKLKKDVSRGNVLLKALLDDIYPQAKVHTEFPVGKGLRLDCYIGAPYNLGFEYDGIQHSQSVAHFGGSEAHSRGTGNDILKEDLCRNRGINLIRIDYTEELTMDLLRERIAEVGHGTGNVKPGYETKQEKQEEKKARLNEHAKKHRQNKYQANKEKAKEYRREQYQRRKEWARANRKNNSR